MRLSQDACVWLIGRAVYDVYTMFVEKNLVMSLLATGMLNKVNHRSKPRLY